MQPLKYERLVAEFMDGLLNTLRSHGTSKEFLAMWVPDDDLVKSIFNMVEAAKSAGETEFALEVSTQTIKAAQIDTLKELVKSLGDFEVDAGQSAYHFRVHGTDVDRSRRRCLTPFVDRFGDGPGRIFVPSQVLWQTNSLSVFLDT